MFQFQGSGRVMVKHLLKESSTMAAAPSVRTLLMFSTSCSIDCLLSRCCSAEAYRFSISTSSLVASSLHGGSEAGVHGNGLSSSTVWNGRPVSSCFVRARALGDLVVSPSTS